MNPLIIALFMGLLAGSGSSWFVTGVYYRAQIADIYQAQAELLAAAEQLFHQRYQAEIERGDVLSAQLSATESKLQTRTQEVQRAISQVTTGKRCLDSAAVRLLNRTPRDDPTVPQAAEPSITESGAIATDTDVASWIGGAQWQYDLCRARLNTLIDFETGRPDDAPRN